MKPVIRIIFSSGAHFPESPPFRQFVLQVNIMTLGFPGGTVVKNPPASAGDIRDVDFIPGLGRSPGEGNGKPLQYSCLEHPIDRGAWRATVHRVKEMDTTEVT